MYMFFFPEKGEETQNRLEREHDTEGGASWHVEFVMHVSKTALLIINKILIINNSNNNNKRQKNK